MGRTITWFAVREENAEQFLKQLGLSPTGETEEFPRSLILMAKLDSGWRVLRYNRYGCPFLKRQHLGPLSRDKDVVLCLIEEHVMSSSSEMWSRGKRKWWLSYEGEDGSVGLATDGDLPESFPRIRKEMEETQRVAGGDDAGTDYIFGIPLKLAETLVGFNHEEDNAHMIGGRYIVLSRTAPNGGLLSRLFRK
jgi:hypothetical protein